MFGGRCCFYRAGFCKVPFDDRITLNGWTLHYFQLKGFHQILTSKNYSEATSVS